MTGSQHLLLFGAVMVAAWLLIIYSWPRILLSLYKRAILRRGFGEGPIPINTLYQEPQPLFAEPLRAALGSGSNLMTTGVNHDTISTAGWLDLKAGPQVLHVPEMAGRYYSVQLTNGSNNTSFAYVGTRATGARAGDYVICGPRWKGSLPQGMTRISSPSDSVLVLGRTLVASDADLPAAYALSKQIRLRPLGG